MPQWARVVMGLKLRKYIIVQKGSWWKYVFQ
jgi:hypothetical protein